MRGVRGMEGRGREAAESKGCEREGRKGREAATSERCEREGGKEGGERLQQVRGVEGERLQQVRVWREKGCCK